MLGGIVVQFDVAFISLVESDTHLPLGEYDSVRVVLVVTDCCLVHSIKVSRDYGGTNSLLT